MSVSMPLNLVVKACEAGGCVTIRLASSVMRMPFSVVTGLERWPVTVSDSSGAGRGMVNCVRAGSLGAVRLKACAWAVLIAEPVSRANTAAVVTFLILLSRVFHHSDFAVWRYSICAMQKRHAGGLVRVEWWCGELVVSWW